MTSESSCSRKTDRSMHKSRRCWVTDVWRRYALTVKSDQRTSGARCGKRCVVISFGFQKPNNAHISRLWMVRSAVQVWINQGDIILLSLRDFQDNKADVIVKYTADEARNRTFLFLFLFMKIPPLLFLLRIFEFFADSFSCSEFYSQRVWGVARER